MVQHKGKLYAWTDNEVELLLKIYVNKMQKNKTRHLTPLIPSVVVITARNIKTSTIFVMSAIYLLLYRRNGGMNKHHTQTTSDKMNKQKKLRFHEHMQTVKQRPNHVEKRAFVLCSVYTWTRPKHFS